MNTPSIPAAAVVQVRERTGAGMMECKKALTDANGDIEAAIVAMRKAGQAKADKKAGRVAAEGIIVQGFSADKKTGYMLEINCETDFVTRSEQFQTFTKTVIDNVVSQNITSLDALFSATLIESNLSVDEARQELIAQIGENIQIRRLTTLSSTGMVGNYLHNNKIGVLVAINTNNSDLAKDLAMQIASFKPLVVNKSEVPADLIEKEREILFAQVKDSGKPQAIIEKMIEGRIEKFLQEVCLVGQSFVKNPDITVLQLLNQHQTEVLGFVRFEVGEGIEKTVTNFAEEVAKVCKE